MTKRDSVCAGIDTPRVSKSVQRRQFAIQWQSRSGAASSDDASSSANAIGTWPQDLNHPFGSDPSGTTSNTHHFGYTSEIPPVPLPQGTEIQQQHRVLHTHIFKEVVSPSHTCRPNRLVVTEVDRWGVQRNRQPEFFFNGIVGHVRSDDYGNIDNWDQAARLANYWRRYFNIPEVHEENASWHNFQQPSDNADRTSDAHEVPPESEMEDNESITANLGTLPIPSQIHQLATVLAQHSHQR